MSLKASWVSRGRQILAALLSERKLLTEGSILLLQLPDAAAELRLRLDEAEVVLGEIAPSAEDINVRADRGPARGVRGRSLIRDLRARWSRGDSPRQADGGQDRKP